MGRPRSRQVQVGTEPSLPTLPPASASQPGQVSLPEPAGAKKASSMSLENLELDEQRLISKVVAHMAQQNEKLFGAIRKASNPIQIPAWRKHNTPSDLQDFIEFFRKHLPDLILFCRRGKAARIADSAPDLAYFQEVTERLIEFRTYASCLPAQEDWPQTNRDLWVLLHTIKHKIWKLWFYSHSCEIRPRDEIEAFEIYSRLSFHSDEIESHRISIDQKIALEKIIELGESLEVSLIELNAAAQNPNGKASPEAQRVLEADRPYLNDKAYVVLLALSRVGQPQGVAFVRNEAHRLGLMIESNEVTKICSDRLKKAGLAKTAANRAWVITEAGKVYLATDARGSSYRFDT